MTAAQRHAPECQLSDCDAEAETTKVHPVYGEIQVCRTCARLFGGDGR